MPFDCDDHSGGGGDGEPNMHQRAIDVGMQVAPQLIELLSNMHVGVQSEVGPVCPDCMMRTVLTKFLVAHCRRIVDDGVASYRGAKSSPSTGRTAGSCGVGRWDRECTRISPSDRRESDSS